MCMYYTLDMLCLLCMFKSEYVNNQQPNTSVESIAKQKLASHFK